MKIYNKNIWSGTIIGITETGQLIFFSNLNDKQIWWDVNDSYSACHSSYKFYTFLQGIISKRQNLLFDDTIEKYSSPVNVVEMRYVS